LKILATCLFGLEKTLAFEIRRAGGENLVTEDGRIRFDGDESALVRCLLTLSVAERLGVVLSHCAAHTFDHVFDAVKRADVPALRLIDPDGCFPVVKGQSVGSKLTSIPALQRTIKKALCEALSSMHHTPLYETGSMFPVRFLLYKDMMTVYLDACGDSLHKRGYRQMSGIAPIRETLASGILDMAWVKPGSALLIDPMCGSGTFIIEAALRKLGIAVGMNRHFAAENWQRIPQSVWREARADLAAKRVNSTDIVAVGYDVDSAAVALAQTNAEKAGVADFVRFERRAVSDFTPPESPFVIVTNPPYAERMSDEAAVCRLYKEMGEHITGYDALFAITPHPRFEELFGKRAMKKRKLYNGKIPCILYKYVK
jgi:putative N6-adenine-specific DNA methylase